MSDKQKAHIAFIRGAQITFHNIRMLTQVSKKIFRWAILCIIMAVILILYFTVPKYEALAAYTYVMAYFIGLFNTNALVSIHTQYGSAQVPVSEVLSNAYFYDAWWLLLSNAIKALLLSITISIIAMIGLSWFLRKRGDDISSDVHIRGATLVTDKQLTQQITKDKKASDQIKLAGVPMLKGTENFHLLFHGSTGTGKTIAYMEILDQIRNPKEPSSTDKRAVIFDDGGAFVSRYYNPARGDIILNPFDERCANWDLWEECKSIPDFENFAAALIPDDGDKDQFWVKSARNLVANIAYKLGQSNQGTIQNLITACFNLSLEQLQEIIKNTPAEQLVDKSIAKTALTIRAVITNFLRSLRYMQGLDDGSRPKFSFRDWILNEKDNHGAWVFITTRDEHHDVIRPLISMWLGLATSRVKSLSRDRDRRIWVLIDELPRLQKLLTLTDTLSVGRNYGLCVALGIQNLSQLYYLYGKDQAMSIIDSLSTHLYYRTNNSIIADEISYMLGEVDIKEAAESYSYGYEQTRDGVQTSRINVTKRLITYTQISMMDPCEAYIRLPSNYPRAKIKFPIPSAVQMATDFQLREINLDERIEALVSNADAEISPDGIDLEHINKLISNTASQAESNDDTSDSRDSDGKETQSTSNKPNKKQDARTEELEHQDEDKSASQQQQERADALNEKRNKVAQELDRATKSNEVEFNHKTHEYDNERGL